MNSIGFKRNKTITNFSCRGGDIVILVDNETVLWVGEHSRRTSRMSLAQRVTSYCSTLSPSLLYVGCANGVIYSFETTGFQLHASQGCQTAHEGAELHILTETGLLSCGRDGFIKFWRLKKEESKSLDYINQILEIDAESSVVACDVVESVDSVSIAVGALGRGLKVWRAALREISPSSGALFTTICEDAPQSVALRAPTVAPFDEKENTCQSAALVAAIALGELYIWDCDTGMQIGAGNAEEHQEEDVNDIAATEGGFLASSHGDLVQIDDSGGYRGRL